MGSSYKIPYILINKDNDDGEKPKEALENSIHGSNDIVKGKKLKFTLNLVIYQDKTTSCDVLFSKQLQLSFKNKNLTNLLFTKSS